MSLVSRSFQRSTRSLNHIARNQNNVLNTSSKRYMSAEFHGNPQTEKAHRKLYLTCAGALVAFSYLGSSLHGTPAVEKQDTSIAQAGSQGSGSLNKPGAATAASH